MKTHQSKRRPLWLLWVGMAMMLVYACTRKDFLSEGLEEMAQREELSIEEAQQWYRTSQSPVFELDIGKKDVLALKAGSNDGAGRHSPVLGKPNWDRAKKGRQGRYAIVEMPIKTKGRMLLLDGDTRSRMDRSQDTKSISNSARLVIQKDLETGDMRTFITVFVGTYDYLKRSSRIHKNGYFKREKDFDGDVLFYQLDGSLINGWRYRNGSIVSRITPVSDTDVLERTARKSSPEVAGSVKWKSSGAYQECDYVQTWVWILVCGTTVYTEWDEEFGDVMVLDYDCTIEEEEQWVEVCQWVPGDPGPDPDPGNPGNPDPGNPGNPTNPGYVDPNLPTNPGGGGPSSPAYKIGDQAPASTPWRDKLTSTDAFAEHLTPSPEGLYLVDENGNDIRDENGERIPNVNVENCHGYAFGPNTDPNSYDPRWPNDVYYPDLSNYDAIGPSGTIQVGDRVCYYGWLSSTQDWTEAILHSAIVTEVDANGFVTKVMGKMGAFYEPLEHHPRDIPELYGNMSPTQTFLDGSIKYNRIYYRQK